MLHNYMTPTLKRLQYHEIETYHVQLLQVQARWRMSELCPYVYNEINGDSNGAPDKEQFTRS